MSIIADFPWRETLIILLLIFLTTSMNYIVIKQDYIQFISESPAIRFVIIFLLAYLSFSLSIIKRYPFLFKVAAALIVALVFHRFISADATLLTLHQGQLIPQDRVCKVDTDCVPRQCCHPTDVINKDHAPDCTKVACTPECRLGTLDCGAGRIYCDQGRCAADVPAIELKYLRS